MKFTAHEFAKAIEARIEALTLEQYHKRPRIAKRLIEELYPISRLALALQQPGLIVEVEALENSGRADGNIWVSGFLNRVFEVQATFAGYERSDALRSKLLVDQGFAPGAGPIERDRGTGQILATMEAEDIYAPVKRLGESICERSKAKAARPYAPGTVLLIAFEDMRIRGRGWWDLLYSAIDGNGGVEGGAFAQIYLFNGCSNELQQAA
jgi:hypothetical protein